MRIKIRLFFLYVSVSLFVIACWDDVNKRAGEPLGVENVNPPGVFPIAKEPVTFHVAIRVDNWIQDIETNYFT